MANAALSPRRLFGRFVPQRHLPTGRINVLPGIGVPMPVGRLVGSSLDASLGRIGSLEVRLARTVGEVKRAQELRYRVFYEEMSAIADARTLMTRRDADAWDAICDHILVIDHANPEVKPFGKTRPRIVGTYRVLRQSVAERHDGFYTAGEYDLQPLIDSKPGLEFLELGRSCVLPAYRGKRTVELLWQGIWAYVLRHRIDVMIGCASLEGTDPRRLALPLSFLHHNCPAPEGWRVRALPHRFTDMNRLSREAVDARAAIQALPPLIKGYLRLGAYIGDGAVVDHQFGTTDVCIVMPVANISERYIAFYGADAGRRAS
ncbi:GNAT family N-acetyltransferase [Siculibacillus lacustris]|uniref:L-ornithine N(alpha)-acyltransferase n=2 Tax=Siculibacillus lacustris TaxID=1549641 RepID=A0A4Q9VK78_9HYPH|nr:GNAT family N-acetyltransferase [Siculibacillus lacustris]